MSRELELRTTFSHVSRHVHIARGALRRLRPHVIDDVSREHVERLKAENEAFRRMPRTEHERVRHDVRAELEAARRQAAGVAVFPLRDAERHVHDCRAFVRQTKRNVELTFPKALNGITPDGMLTLGLLKEHRRARLLTMSVDGLLRTYADAQTATDSATAFVDASLIEETLDYGIGVAATVEELPTLKRLREFIEGVQELRVPLDLPDVDALEADIRALAQRAQVLDIQPVNPDHDPLAAATYGEQEALLLDAGRAPDREELAAQIAADRGAA